MQCNGFQSSGAVQQSTGSEENYIDVQCSVVYITAVYYIASVQTVQGKRSHSSCDSCKIKCIEAIKSTL